MQKNFQKVEQSRKENISVVQTNWETCHINAVRLAQANGMRGGGIGREPALRTAGLAQSRGEALVAGSPPSIPHQCSAFTSASLSLSVGLTGGILQREMLMSPLQTPSPLSFGRSHLSRPFWSTTGKRGIKSLAWKLLFTPQSITYSILWRHSMDLGGEFGPLYGMRRILKTYPKYVNSQTIALQSKA